MKIMVRKQIDVEGRILECLEQSAKEDNTENGEAFHLINTLSEDIYGTNSPTNSQLKSLYRAVSNLEKKGFIYKQKYQDVDTSSKRGGVRYQKEIVALVKNGKIVKK